MRRKDESSSCETSRLIKSFSDYSRNTSSMPVSHAPAVGLSIHESVLSFRKVHETSHSPLLISTESELASSGSFMDDFTTVVMTSFPSSPLFTNQESSAVKKVFAPTKATSLTVTQRSNPSTLGPQSTNQVLSQTEKVSLAISSCEAKIVRIGAESLKIFPTEIFDCAPVWSVAFVTQERSLILISSCAVVCWMVTRCVGKMKAPVVKQKSFELARKV